MAMELQGKTALINGGKGTGALPEPAVGVLVQFRAKSARSPRRSITRVLVPRFALATCNFDIGRARSLQELFFICSCVGFCAAGGIVGLYAIFLRGFPVGSRASGSGLGRGVGRCASAVAPIAAGRFDLGPARGKNPVAMTSIFFQCRSKRGFHETKSPVCSSMRAFVDISIPVAVTVFPGEIYRAPKSWTQRAYPRLIYFNEVDKGGHFAAWEQPALFASEVREAFKSLP